ncbi:hypothetical protein, partial [Desulfobacter latus]|uniref:hypothetical protein n=1 Tax=Desulfobacter latus TaxID=2292 RepID=UPI001C498545
EAIRGHIAVSGFLAMQNSQYGLITNLSRQFNVSRTFIYDAINGILHFPLYTFQMPTPIFREPPFKKCKVLLGSYEGCPINSLKSVLSIIFNKAPSKINSVDEKKVLSYILSLRLEGKCS